MRAIQQHAARGVSSMRSAAVPQSVASRPIGVSRCIIAGRVASVSLCSAAGTCSSGSSSGAVLQAATHIRRQRHAHICGATAESVPAGAPLVAVEGDIVTLHFAAKSPEGEVIESTRDDGEPLSFEIGAGEIMGNPIFKAFDGAVRGLGVGERVELEMSGGDWQPELLFTVPRDHPEVERLEGRYKNVGGLAEGLVVELANGRTAVVLEVGPEAIKLDANNLGAGKTLLFELELLDIRRGEE